MIGTAQISDNYPLYYDAVNEQGLAMAGLSFPGFACYQPKRADRDNVAPFELIPWILGQCSDVEQALPLLDRLSVLDLAFSADLPLTPLHWILTDRHRSVVLESMEEGLHIHENPVDVLANAPSFPEQLHHLAQFLSLSPSEPQNRMLPGLSIPPVSRGTGCVGLPGDFSSLSRFVRATFLRSSSCCGSSEEELVTQLFHLLAPVSPVRGCVRPESNEPYFTRCTCCYDLNTGIHYHTTYENCQITGVDLHAEPLDGQTLISYPLFRPQQIPIQNRA